MLTNKTSKFKVYQLTDFAYVINLRCNAYSVYQSTIQFDKSCIF